jgi:ribonuclease HII
VKLQIDMAKILPKKRGDTLVKTIEKKYGVDLGYRSDAQLHTVLKKEGLPSLSKLLKMTRAGR